MPDGNQTFDERSDAEGSIRPAYRDYDAWFQAQDTAFLRRKHLEAEGQFRRTGITFNVYGEDEAEERRNSPRSDPS